MFAVIDGMLVYSVFKIDPDTGLPALGEGEAWVVQARLSGAYDLYLATEWDEYGKVLDYRYSKRLAYYSDTITKHLIRKVANEIMIDDYEYERKVAAARKRNEKYEASLLKESFWHVPKWLVRLADKYDNRGREKAKRREELAVENNPKYAKVYETKEEK